MGFINWVDNANWPQYKDWKVDVSSVIPSSEGMKELSVVSFSYKNLAFRACLMYAGKVAGLRFVAKSRKVVETVFSHLKVSVYPKIDNFPKF